MNLDGLISKLAKDDSELQQPRTVVRVSTSAFKQGSSIVLQKRVTILKRKSVNDWLFSDDLNGMPEHIERISNLHEVVDGIYELIATDFSYDTESGYPEDWNYELVPYHEDKS